MLKNLTRLSRDESGSVYVEYALLIIGVVFTVASTMFDLGSATGDKIGELESKIGSVGTP